ncbi:hypothetical protein AHiyo8_46930 [Arthrobacter sp. Hiyo8]|nr:hypothetical protein AHiyo8_46930 [Arthrobacter sp. Hiyo8]
MRADRASEPARGTDAYVNGAGVGRRSCRARFRNRHRDPDIVSFAVADGVGESLGEHLNHCLSSGRVLVA